MVSSSSANATNDASSTGVARGNNAEMIVTGLMAAVYFLTTVAWLIVALRSPIEFADLLANSMFILGLWVAVAAGPLWFVGIMVFGRELGFGRRLTLYVIGALLIIPWPYLSWAAG